MFVFDLEEAGVKTGENVGDTVVHDQHVDSCPLLPQDDQPCPGVHHQGENSNRYVGKKVAVFLVHIHLSSITYQAGIITSNIFSVDKVLLTAYTHLDLPFKHFEQMICILYRLSTAF